MKFKKFRCDRIKNSLFIVLAFSLTLPSFSEENVYRFKKGETLVYELELETIVHLDTKKVKKRIPLHSLYQIRFYVVDNTPEGEALIAAVSDLIEVGGKKEETEKARLDEEYLKPYLEWMRNFRPEDSAALILDRYGNIIRGRMPWPEATCYHLPKILEGISLKKAEGVSSLGGRFQIDNRASGTETHNGKVFTIYRTQNSTLALALLYDNQMGLPLRLEAKYGYKTFWKFLLEHLKMKLVEIVPTQSGEAFLADENLMSARIQASLLSRTYDMKPEFIRKSLLSKNSGLRQIAASYCSVSGVLDKFDFVDQEKDEVVRLNLAKTVFKHRQTSSPLIRLSEKGSFEIKTRAKNILKHRKTGAKDRNALISELADSLSQGISADAAYRRAREIALTNGKDILHFGPRSFSLSIGENEKRIFHYSVHVPEDYDPDECFPCLIELSGGNGFSESVFLQSKKIIPVNHIIVSPDADNGYWWEKDRIRMFDALLDRIFRDYAIDPDRIYLHGFSNGGIGAYLYGYHHADRFAAVASLEGYSRLEDGRRGVETEMNLNMRNTPLLIMHGERDPVISIKPNRLLAEFLDRNRIPHKFIELSNEGHRVSFAKYSKRILDYFRKHKRNPAPKKLILVVDDMRYNRNFWVRVEEKNDPHKRARVNAEIKKNAFVLKTKNVKKISLLLNDLHYEDGMEYEIKLDKKTVFKGILKLDPVLLLESLRAENDIARLYGIRLSFDVD